MMNLLGLGPLKKSASSPNNEKQESPSSSPLRKLTFFGGSNNGNSGSSKEKEKDGNGKVVVVGANSATIKEVGNSFGGKKVSKKEATTSTTTTSSTKLKLQKAASGDDGGGKVKPTYTTIDPASFGANGTAAAVVAEVVAGEDPAKKELDELRDRATEVANESLASTRRMAEFCEQAKDAGIKIIVALDDQKEQLDRIQDSLTVMREDLIHAEKNLRGMDKCCGIFNNPFKKTNFKEDEKMWTDGLDGAVVTENATVPRRPFTPAPTLGWPLNRGSSSKDQNQSNNPVGGAGYIPKITEDETEDEMEKNMTLVSSMLGNLRNMAIDMNTEIESQNKQMNIINDMTEQNNARIDDAIQKTHDLKRQ